MINKKRTAAVGATEVPIFLQKAYHMIDTCDPSICSWSEDGLTFIVKNTFLFETTIIPQFFKHNKFSSFVRQLNFYGFRKVKFSNSLRIDRKLEAETAKFWRFRHEKFRRGRKDLLVDIRRTPSAGVRDPNPNSTMSTSRAAVPDAPVSSATIQPTKLKSIEKPEEVTHLKTEMQELKQRIASMTRNIDELTNLVKHTSIKDEQVESSPMVSPGSKLVEPEAALKPGNKRKKMDGAKVKRENAIVDFLPIMPSWNQSCSNMSGVDSLLSGDQLLPDLATSSRQLAPLEAPPSPRSDESFVDDLFMAFADEDAIIPGMEGLEKEPDAADVKPNQPCPRLMKRIEESLSTIPREIHEMVANRLIDAISDTKPIAMPATCLFSPQGCSSPAEEAVHHTRSLSVDEAQAVSLEGDRIAEGAREGGHPPMTSVPLPLAVAALKTILSEYGVSVECRRNRPCKNALDEETFATSLPVVPMHA